jgi:hypothetical protein
MLLICGIVGHVIVDVTKFLNLQKSKEKRIIFNPYLERKDFLENCDIERASLVLIRNYVTRRTLEIL